MDQKKHKIFEKIRNFSVELLSRHLQTNYTSLETTHQLPALSVQPIQPLHGVGLGICALEHNAARVKTPNQVCPKALQVTQVALLLVVTYSHNGYC